MTLNIAWLGNTSTAGRGVYGAELSKIVSAHNSGVVAIKHDSQRVEPKIKMQLFGCLPCTIIRIETSAPQARLG